MRKLFFSTLTAAIFFTAFVSCGDDNEDNGGASTNYSDYEYSQLTPEQQKEKLGTDANSFLDKMKGMSDAKGADLLQSFADRCDINEPDLEKTATAGSVIAINEFNGKFTWTESTQTWKKEAQTGKLTFILPSTPAGKTNNATIDITGVASTANLDGYQLPQELLAKLYVSSTEVGSVSVKATSVSADKAPSTVDVIYSMDSYSLVVNATKGGTNTTTFELKKGDEVLITGSGDIVGNMDGAISNKNANLGVSNITMNITSNLAVAGSVEFGKIEDAENKLTEPSYPSRPYTLEIFNNYVKAKKEYSEQKATIRNNNSDLYLVSRSDKAKIAAVKYISKIKYSYTDTMDGAQYTDIYYTEVEALKFGDGTMVEAEVYFSKGFSAVLDKWEDIIAKFQ